MEQSKIIDTLETYHRAGHGRQEQAARSALVWEAGARRPEVEEALRPLDGHRTITGARSFILTKLTKPSACVNLVGPQVNLPLWRVPVSRGSILFFGRNKEALPSVQRYSW